MRSYAAAAVLLVPLVLASCTEETAGPLSERRQPESISLSAADIELDDGDTLQVFANLLDQNENVFSTLPEDVDIAWSTDEEDVADVLADGRLIANSPGTTTLRATAGDGISATASVQVRAVARGIEVVDDSTRNGLPNAALADSITLRVVDRHGNGVPGTEVRFRVVTGGGSISPGYAVSDGDGLVRIEWTLGPVIGDQRVQAFAPGAGSPVDIDAVISQVVFSGIDVPTTATQGGTLAGSLTIDTDLFPVAVGAAHVVLSWDPAKLQLQGASVTSGDYDVGTRWFDNVTGELHLVVSDPTMVRGLFSAADLTFDVVGGAGTTTTIEMAFEQLVGTNFLDASAAGVPADVVIDID